jgi:glycosyltransferase involved in cell wall biosynthesis
MKKRILFVIDSLHCAGAEKSLTTLLALIDYSKYSVDLQLFTYGGLLESLVPEGVNILKPIPYFEYSSRTLKKSLFYSVKVLKFKMLISRVSFSLCIRRKSYGNSQIARIFWQCASEVIENNPKEYDIAVSYAQGVPTFYVADKVKAKKKFAWVNANYRLSGEERNFQAYFYNQYTNIVTVSEFAKQVFIETFPQYENKLKVIYDINDADLVCKMADEENPYFEDTEGIKLLTIGRLDKLKGYDIALEACKMLVQKGIKFKWYVLGVGPLRERIEDYIRENNLSEYFLLLGIKSNPYPFIKNCDFYVQTSRTEGFGLAIAEARMLNKLIVTTEFDGVYNQMKDSKNGLVVGMNAESLCNGILKLLKDKELRESIIGYLKTEKKGNVEEIEKFYKLIG